MEELKEYIRGLVNTVNQKQRQPKLPVLLEEDESNNTEDEDFVDARDIILEELLEQWLKTWKLFTNGEFLLQLGYTYKIKPGIN